MNQRGFSLIETVVAVGLAASAFTGIISVSRLYLHAALESQQKTVAFLYAEEGIEAVRSLRDTSYANSLAVFSAGTAYYLFWNGFAWQATSTAQPFIANRYERTFEVAPVTRNSADAIEAGGTPDANTKKVTVSVSWNQSAGTTTITLSSYFTNLFNE